MPDSQVFYAESDGVHALRFVGNIRYTIAPPIDRLLADLIDRVTPEGFVVDLRETSMIDSTTLGLLARIAKWLAASAGRRPTLISTNDEINELLLAVGFYDVFDIVDTSGETIPSVRELDLIADASREDLARVVLDAHRALVALGGENVLRFRDVVSLMEADLAKLESSGG